jgi:(1->4)-alpha-D-glucan 1-alpha-D-glucosylmutase
LLTSGSRNKFLANFIPFQRLVARFGLWNSLSQTLLKLTCPGVPDIYQGNDVWDFSLVDPDNRRPVDYVSRREALESITEAAEPAGLAQLLMCPEDGRPKMHVIRRTLSLRQQQPELFSQGEYLPLAVEGQKAQHVVAFARKFRDSMAVVVAPRLVAALLGNSDQPPMGHDVWGVTHILMPDAMSWTAYQNVFSGEIQSFDRSESHSAINLSIALKDFPVALCLLT